MPDKQGGLEEAEFFEPMGIASLIAKAFFVIPLRSCGGTWR